jgi:TRAP-type uncharacterized transport system substrate-binding protein
MPFLPGYQTEGHIYAQYLIQAHPQGRVAVLFQNDDFGRDLLKGLKDGLRDKLPIVAEVGYQTSESDINTQIAKLKASGADILFDASTSKFTVMAIRRMAEIGWRPVHIVDAVSNSADTVMRPAGLENAEGLLSGFYLKDPDDPAFRGDAAVGEFRAFVAQYLPEAESSSALAVWGYTAAQLMVEVLKQSGDDLTRENIMTQAASLKGVQLGMLLPGIVINTSAADYAPIEQMQMQRFTKGKWERFGDVLSGVDPGVVSEGFKAIFKYSSAKRQTTDQLNANTVTLMTGAFGGTDVQIGADLAAVLDDGDNFRLLPVIGRGSVQGIADVLFLRGVDAGIVRSDTLEYLEKKGYADNIKQQFTYISRLYNEEMHVIAPRTIRKVADLDGKTVAIDLPDGGTFVTSITMFGLLGIRPHFLYIEQRLALEKLRKGEIDAVIAVEGKPVQSILQMSAGNLHLVPVDYDRSLQADYLPAQLTADDYPNLIATGERVDTIATAAVLAAYNFAPKANPDRYQRLARFVETLFGKIANLQRPPFHPKWKEVALNAALPGWTRFRPAQEWLERGVVTTLESREKFDQFLASRPAGAPAPALDKPEDRESLFRQFMEWSRRQ